MTNHHSTSDNNNNKKSGQKTEHNNSCSKEQEIMETSVVFIYVVDETKDDENKSVSFHFKSYARCHIQSTLQLMGVKQRDADSITGMFPPATITILCVTTS